MKDGDFLVKKSKKMVSIFSANGKKEYAFLYRLKTGQVIRIFVYDRICGGILAEGSGSKDMSLALDTTIEKIRKALN